MSLSLSRWLTVLLGLLYSAALYAGSYQITHFQRSNGFPANYVYYIYQDKDGYIWMGTDNGLVSYNGHSFRTYTTKDGLPDNEVFAIISDRQGRLWLPAYTKEICYMQDGKIHNKHNDSLLKRIKLKNIPRGIACDRWNNIFIMDGIELILVNPSGRISRITRLGTDSFFPYFQIQTDSSGTALLQSANRFYRYNQDHFELALTLPHADLPMHIFNQNMRFCLEEFAWTPRSLFIQRHSKGISGSVYATAEEMTRTIRFLRLQHNKIALCLKDGLYLKDLYNGRTLERHLEGSSIANAMYDKTGALWVATLGQGAFRIAPLLIGNVPLKRQSEDVCFLHADKGILTATSGEGMLIQLRSSAGKQPQPWREQWINPEQAHTYSPYAAQRSDGRWVAAQGTNLHLYPATGATREAKPPLPFFTKRIFEEDSVHLLAGSATGLFRIDKYRFTITDTLLEDRITALTKVKDTVYAGTLNGLYKAGPGQQMRPVPIPGLGGHIMALTTDADSILWVATNDAALYALVNNRILTRLDHNNGFSCNTVHALKASKHLLWMGTDNGLYALSKGLPFRVTRHLSETQGMNSNLIRCLEIQGSRIWAGSNKGLNYFEESTGLPAAGAPAFFIKSILNEDTLHPISLQGVPMELKGKTLRIDFDVVDHSGAGQPRFSYRLNRDTWTGLDNNSLYFPTLPYGNFTISLQVTAPGWAAPISRQLSFYRPYPWYLRWWFLLPATLLLLVLTGLLARLYFLRAGRKERERLLVQQNLLQLEQLALQGQMNSHFIFNCIAAIRQYYNKGDTARANRFVDAFSALVRTTFEMVNQTFIPLDKELKYLEQYLKVEQERFNHSFRFAILKEISTAIAHIPVPTLLLQPLVENAVRHGVRSLPDGMGMIHIAVTQQAGQIRILIEDNGPGRKRNPDTNTRERPMASITSTTVNTKRISILNRLFGQRIDMHIADIPDKDGQIAGTRVTLTYPLNIYEFQS